jgi:uncharacterized LabA/DUF88 family protein
MAEERLKMAVFVDFDNIQIGVKDTLGKDFDVSIVLEALKERGEVVTKYAYGDWPRAGEQSRQMTQHAVQMVQRNVTPRGDKNGADINLALDALEMAFTRDHINAFVIVGGDSDFIALVEKLKQYDKRVFVVGGRQFTSGILQRNCHEFIAYENLLKSGGGGDGPRAARSARGSGRASAESRPLSAAMPNIQRALKVLAEREVAPQVGLLKSTLLQLDATFSERDYGRGSFLEFIQKLAKAHLVRLRKTERGYLVEPMEAEAGGAEAPEAPETAEELPVPAATSAPEPAASEVSPGSPSVDPMALLKQALSSGWEKSPSRPLYLRQVRQMMRALDSRFDERQAGFRGLLDLLHQAQREGLLRLHRDRKGTWRAFPVSSTPAAPPSAAEAVAETQVTPEVEPAPAEGEGVRESVAEAEAFVASEPEAVMVPAAEEAVAVEASGARKARKPRARAATGKTTRRKTSRRSKAKEPAEQ